MPDPSPPTPAPTPAAHSNRGHAKFAPSSADRWLACPASIRLYEMFPPPVEDMNPEAIIGTQVHEVAEKLLDTAIYGHVAPVQPPELVTRAQSYVNYVMQLLDFINGLEVVHEVLVEQRLMTRIKDCWGTCDCVIVAGTECWIIDLKTGRVIVPAENNEQLLTYAVAVKAKYPLVTTFHLVIVQDADAEAPVKSWTCEAPRVAAHKAAIKRATATWHISEPVMGDHCGYCRVKANCTAHQTAALAVFDSSSATPALQTSLTPAQKLFIVQNKPAIERFMKAVMAEALQHPPEGFKVVAGNSRTRWREDAPIEEVMRAYSIPMRQIPPTISEVRKVLKEHYQPAGVDNILAPLTEIPIGKPTLVPSTDPRPALVLTTAVFEDESE